MGKDDPLPKNIEPLALKNSFAINCISFSEFKLSFIAAGILFKFLILSSYIFSLISFLSLASFKLNIKRTNNCPINAFVDATPISGPA